MAGKMEIGRCASAGFETYLIYIYTHIYVYIYIFFLNSLFEYSTVHTLGVYVGAFCIGTN
jgi:hypothetical protein